MTWISDWTLHTDGICSALDELLEAGTISETDIVFMGPSGDAVVAPTPAHLDEEYLEYVDSGTVMEFLG